MVISRIAWSPLDTLSILFSTAPIMTKFTIRSTQPINLTSGNTVEGHTDLATIDVHIEGERPADLLNLLSGGFAVVVSDEVEGELAGAMDEDELAEIEESLVEKLSFLSDEQKANLAGVGVVDLKTAEAYLNENGKFTAIDKIGPATSRKLEELVASELAAAAEAGNEDPIEDETIG